jgi:hypothetical protein
MTDETEELDEGRANAIDAEAEAATERIKKGQHWDDWVKVSVGFGEGRRYAMHKSGMNRPVGTGYNKAFSGWMDARPWTREHAQSVRNHCLWVAENLPALQAFRETMASNVRELANHPTTMKRRWDKEHKKEGEGKPRKNTTQELNESLAKLDDENNTLKKQLEKAKAVEEAPFNLRTDSVKMIVDVIASEVTQHRLAELAKALTAEASRRAKIKNGRAA